MATPNYKPLLNSSENLKALLAEQNAGGITSAVFSGNEPIDVLSAKTIFNAAKSAEDIAGVSSITAGTGISVSGATGAVTISSTVTGTLPTQTGNSGKLLTTDGTNSSWTTTPVATSLTGPAATSLTLSGGSSGASLVLGSGAASNITLTPTGGGRTQTAFRIQSTKGGTYSTEGSEAITITANSNSSMLLGADDANNLTYIQSMQAGTSFSNRHLAIQPNGGYATIGGAAATATVGSGGLKVFGTATATSTTSGAVQIGSNIGLSGNAGGPSYFGGNLSLIADGTNTRYVALLNSTSSYAGRVVLQAGGGSAAFGGALVAYGHSHATKPGWVTAGISAGSGGKFSVNDSGLGDGTDLFTVTGATGAATFASAVTATNTTSGALIVGSNVGLSGNAGGPSYFGGAVTMNSAYTDDTLSNFLTGNTSSYATTLGNYVKTAEVRSGTVLKSNGSIHNNFAAGSFGWYVGQGVGDTAYDTYTPLLAVTSSGATFAGLVFPQQATTAGAPAYAKGAIYFDTTLNKLRVGGASAWETVTSV